MRLFLGKKRNISISASIKFEPRDLWVGVYWNPSGVGAIRGLTVYLCIVPMLPLRIHVSYIRFREA